tara:strand:+ start:364 stop:1371 length:1008 start_codon:yes stop_codon:yes gene_type:complete
MIYKKRIILIDYIRALAILLVILGHFRHIFLPNYNGENHLIYFISSFGHFGVILFFGLSGILASDRLNMINSFSDILGYLKLRLLRIYIVLPFALLATFIFDFIALNLNLYSNISDLNIISQESSPENRLKLHLFLSNLFSLQTFTTTFFGSNGPLWSLSYEIWFYILGALSKKIKTPLLFSFVIFIDYKFYIFFLFWYYIGNIKSLKINNFTFSLSTIIIIILHLYKPFNIDIFYCLYFIVLYHFFKNKKLPSFKPVSYLAKISFSLYIFHYPILLFISFFLFGDSIKNFNIFQTVICTFIVFIICIKLYDFIENSNYSNALLRKVRQKLKNNA